MQRALDRRRSAVARESESDSESDEERALVELERLCASAAGARAVGPWDVKEAADEEHLEDERDAAQAEEAEQEQPRGRPLAPRFASSGAQLRLHTFDARASPGGAETKIGGHALDHKRPFQEGWLGLGGPLKTAVAGAVRALGSVLSPLSSPAVAAGQVWPSSRSSPAFDVRDRDVLVYSSVKIAGHPMDHVPFLSRGQPSRPLWGYVPNLSWPAAVPTPPLPPSRLPPARARMYQLEPSALANLYDCSRCLRLRQTPRVQLSCGHGLCAGCASSRAIRHAEVDRACFLECARCDDLVAVEAVVFTNHVVRLQPPPARSLSELTAQAEANAGSSSRSLSSTTKSALTRLGLAWRHGGVIAVLSFLAGRLYPAGKARRSALDNWHGVRRSDGSALGDVQEMVAPLPEVAARLLLDDVADMAKHLAPSADEVVASGPSRWEKRVRGLQPPSRLLRFEFVRTLGVGNFAEVMLVRNRKGELLVLKESDKLPEAVNEIKLLSRISSPHVVRIHQYFVEEVGHRHFAYIEMEYCDGGDLLQLLRDKGPVVEDKFDSIFLQLCAGLKEIHDRGIVHRDLKPGNVLMTTDGVAKIADFGVSTCLESDLLTHHAAGTLAFMAPEVRRYFLGEDVSYDATADIWSLGALAVAMLTGNPEPRVATRPLEEVVDELRERGLSDKSVALVERTLQRQPEKRPALADLMANAYPAKARL